MQRLIEESQQLLAEKQANGEALTGKGSKLEKNLSEELKELKREREEDMEAIAQLLQQARGEKDDDQVTE